jgi:large conductance mechanosensitive channel protein
MLQGFKQFMLRGNVLDLAVAVVMGAAFGAVVTALVKDFAGVRAFRADRMVTVFR